MSNLPPFRGFKQTIYGCRDRFGGMTRSEVTELKALQANSSATLSLSERWVELHDDSVIEPSERPGKGQRSTTKFSGEDDLKPAMMRHVDLIADKECSLQKLVKCIGERMFFDPDIYRWNR